jgi:RND superfamily putative drug exporter
LVRPRANPLLGNLHTGSLEPVFSALAGVVDRHPWRVLAIVLAIVAIAAPLGIHVRRHLEPGGFDVAGSESAQAREIVEQASGTDPASSVLALVRLGAPIETSGSQHRIARIEARLRRDPAVAAVLDWRSARNPGMVAHDRRSTYLIAALRPLNDQRQEQAAKRLLAVFAGDSGVTLGGNPIANQEISKAIEDDLRRAELLALPLIVILSFFLFRGFVASLLVPIAAGITVLVSFFLLRELSSVTSLSIYALNLVTGLSIGLSIDWSLLLLSRYREERAKTSDLRLALRRALVPAGHTIFFSALTVAASMATLLVFPLRFLKSMGYGGIVASTVAMLVALLVLPTLLRLLGGRIDALTLPRWRDPLRVAVSLVALASGRSSHHQQPHSGRDAGHGSDDPRRNAGVSHPVDDGGRDQPAGVRTSLSDRPRDQPFQRIRAERRHAVLPRPAGAANGRSFRSRARGEGAPSRGRPRSGGPRFLGGNTWQVNLIEAEGPYSLATQKLVGRLRSVGEGDRLAVGGDAAAFRDERSAIGSHIPLAIALLAAATIVILFLLSKSLVAPLLSLAMTALTLAAAFGALILIFQDGRFEGLLGYTSQGALDLTIPLVLAALVFAISTDYGVFLLSRVREARLQGRGDRDAIGNSVATVGRIVTSAAVLFAVSIGVFGTSNIVVLKILGIGTALAVLADSLLVRCLLLPASLRLLGPRAWWLPSGLARLHERIGLHEDELFVPVWQSDLGSALRR